MSDTCAPVSTAHAADIAPRNIEQLHRQPIYIPAGDTTIFGWLHHAASVPHKNCVAIICAPMGYEYTHSHRSIRHLADHLARSGVASLRFDYRGTGDSPGSDADSNRVSGWRQDIEAAIDYAKHSTGCSKVCLIGIRLGATFAALAAQKNAVDFLVLWNPCISGRRYLREMQLIAASATAPQNEQSAIMESAGFAMTKSTAAEINAINLLTEHPLTATRALIVHRDDLGEDSRLADKLRAEGMAVDQMTTAGYADMMAEPQFTVVPTQAIDGITQWIKSWATDTDASIDLSADAAHATQFNTRNLSGDDIPLTEQLCRFGPHNQLFGVLSFINKPTNDKPAVVLINSGSVHHVGPNRIYVTLARTLATLGYTCFRLDLEGLGDSILLGDGRENHPYPDTADRDVETTLQYLRAQFGCSRFVLLGLCSGAHAAFHGGVKLNEYDIADVIAINPLTYQFVEGMSLETTQHFQDVAYYKSSVRNVKSWLKLLSGKVNIKYIAGVAHAQLKVVFHTAWQALRERLSTDTIPLAHDLNRLFQQERTLSLFISERDPGYALLMAGAKYTATKAIKSGKIRLQFIAGADHTFSTLVPRMALIERICTHLEQQFKRNN